MQSTIILIGPPRAGKSTVGKLLAAQMEQPFSDLTKVGQQYYAEQGHERDVAGRAWQEGGLAGLCAIKALSRLTRSSVASKSTVV